MKISCIALMGILLAAGGAAATAAEPYFLTADELRALAAEATEALDQPIVTVADKAASPTGSVNDYVSYARYYWPDPNQPDGLPYVSRDGVSNEPQVAKGDHPRIWAFCRAIEKLAARWHLERDEAAARRAGEWLRAWFIAPATRMSPNLEYAQIRLGHPDREGHEFGVLEARCLAQAIDALRLLADSPALTDGEAAHVHAWFSDYLKWLIIMKPVIQCGPGQNNHITWYLAQAMPIARYVGRDDYAWALAEEAKYWIGEQIQPDGSQPHELARTNPLGYSVFNLEAYVRVARYAAGLGVDLWAYEAPGGASLPQAIAFLRPYNRAPETAPFAQQVRAAPGFLDALLAEQAHARSSTSAAVAPRADN